jgi:putative Mn2+ efflux pump MntP
MKEVMYDQNSLVIAGILFVSMALAIEVGYRIGRRAQTFVSDSSKAHVNAIQASLLGVLALLLGFTFSLSLQRFDSRSVEVVEESNAIGTAYLRAQLLPPSIRSEVQKLLQSYLNLRVQAGAITLSNEAEREVLLTKAD